MRLIFGTQDTRNNNEDFALTPYLFFVKHIGKVIRVYGIGICWGYFSGYIGIGFNLPKGHPTFSKIKKK